MKFALLLATIFAATLRPACAASDGLVTVPSTHGLRDTIDRFESAVRAQGWVVFTEIDHAAAARAAGMPLDPRIVVLFGNPRGGTPAMAAHPTLALDLPMRVLVWQDGAGQVFVTRNTGAALATHVFARHDVAIPPAAQQDTDSFLAGLVDSAVK